MLAAGFQPRGGQRRPERGREGRRALKGLREAGLGAWGEGGGPGRERRGPEKAL